MMSRRKQGCKSSPKLCAVLPKGKRKIDPAKRKKLFAKAAHNRSLKKYFFSKRASPLTVKYTNDSLYRKNVKSPARPFEKVLSNKSPKSVTVDLEKENLCFQRKSVYTVQKNSSSCTEFDTVLSSNTCFREVNQRSKSTDSIICLDEESENEYVEVPEDDSCIEIIQENGKPCCSSTPRTPDIQIHSPTASSSIVVLNNSVDLEIVKEIIKETPERSHRTKRTPNAAKTLRHSILLNNMESTRRNEVINSSVVGSNVFKNTNSHIHDNRIKRTPNVMKKLRRFLINNSASQRNNAINLSSTDPPEHDNCIKRSRKVTRKLRHFLPSNEKTVENDVINLSSVGSNVYTNNLAEIIPREGLRPIIIDGSNVAFRYSNGAYFATKALQICIDFFKRRGHKVIAFVPKFRENMNQSDNPELLRAMAKAKDVIFTPSRMINGRRVTSYDDRYIVQTAVLKGGIIVSTDNYSDLLLENASWKDTIMYRLLNFTWVDDIIMFPSDPLGASGPKLDEFLRFS